MGWRLLFWYINVYSSCYMNIPFSNLKNAFVALCYFCEATVLQIDNPYKKNALSHSTSLTYTALKQSLSHPPLLLTPPQHPFFFLPLWSAPPRPAAEQSGADRREKLSRAELITGSVWKLSSLLLLLLQQVAENYLPLPFPHSHTLTEHILNHL